MTRKIFLDGELATKFGPVFNFSGPTIADALRCIDANRPNFRKYLIECHEKDVGFTIEVQGKAIEFAEECILPLSKGDILFTPVPAGSKSGGLKVLAAIAIIGFMWWNPFAWGAAGSLLPGGAGFAALGAGGQIAALGSTLLALNLATVGLHQLMAPDPSTDKQGPESYLFNGNERTVIEGDPVPILYGELAVPGFPIDFGVSNEG